MNATSLPIKINLFLAVKGLLRNGYHDLFSLVLPIHPGDTASLTYAPHSQNPDRIDDTWGPYFDGLPLPSKADNSMVKALQAFRNHHAFSGSCHLTLKKTIPFEAGLGGGSSNAAFVLRSLNQKLNHPIKKNELHAIAKKIGADVPFFLNPEAALMEGTGNLLSTAPQTFIQALKGKSCLLFKPPFGIATPEAYQFLRENQFYTPILDPEAFLSSQLSVLQTMGLFHNDFLKFTEAKFPIIPTLLNHLKKSYSIPVGLSGSGSCCFAIFPSTQGHDLIPKITSTVHDAFGPNTWVQEAFL
jgi:4-diphosphocytidyl-2-C-methyl-D-erythritol kinase